MNHDSQLSRKKRKTALEENTHQDASCRMRNVHTTTFARKIRIVLQNMRAIRIDKNMFFYCDISATKSYATYGPSEEKYKIFQKLT